jgi:putative ABC transport system permease protein
MQSPIAARFLFGEAVRALLRQKALSALTALSVTIGIAALVWVVAIGKSGSERAEEQLQALGDNLVWVEAGSRNVAGVRTGTHGTTSLTAEDALAIRDEVRLIKSMSPQADGSVLVIANNRNWTTRYRGVTPPYLDIRRYQVAQGACFSDEEVETAANVVVIGQTVKEQLFGSADPVGQEVRIAGLIFQITGVLAPKGQSASGYDQDDTLFLPYTTVLKKLRGKGFPYLDDIMCSAVSPEAVTAAAADISSLMRQRHHIGPGQEDDFNIRHPEELIKAQMEESRTFAQLLISIACVALIVGGIGIMNMMLASVADRTREIGIRLAIGATEGAVQLQFLAEAVVLCLFGGITGVALSVVGSYALDRLLGWPMSIPPQAVGLALAFSIGVGVFFGFYPARRAARLDPIAALRRE